jgi:hypothetical protein
LGFFCALQRRLESALTSCFGGFESAGACDPVAFYTLFRRVMPDWEDGKDSSRRLLQY